MKLLELDRIHRYQTDKLGRESPHDYTESYERHFRQFQKDELVLWEIGVDRGDSLRMWRDYFPKSTVVGIDIVDRRIVKDDNRIQFVLGDINEVWSSIASEQFPDIVIDDGSHKALDIRMAFSRIFPLTKLLYVVEDLGTQYETLHGKTYLNAEPFTELVHHKCNNLAMNRYAGGASRVCWEPGQVYIYR